MKKVTLTLILLLVISSVAFAEWLVDFRKMYNTDGIDDAVVLAMEKGASPDMIIENGLQLEGLNASNLVKALYCAGAKGNDIRRAAKKWEISDLMVIAGYQKSVAECAEAVADAQPFTPRATGSSFTTINAGGGERPISQSSFPEQ